MTNKEIVTCFYEVIVSQNLLHELDEYISESCVLNTGGCIFPLGIKGMEQHLLDVRKTYPDYTMKIIRQFADGGYVVSEFTMEGTHEGEWIGMKPSHKRLTFSGVNIDKVEDGKIMEHGGAVNTFETLYEAGLIKSKDG